MLYKHTNGIAFGLMDQGNLVQKDTALQSLGATVDNVLFQYNTEYQLLGAKQHWKGLLPSVPVCGLPSMALKFLQRLDSTVPD